MEAACEELFNRCKFDKTTKESLVQSFSTLGVEEIEDLTFIKDTDLIKAGIKVVPARKLLHYFKNQPRGLSKSSGKNHRNSASDPRLSLSSETTTRERSRSRSRTNPWIGETKDTAFATQFHCLREYVNHLRLSLSSSSTDALNPNRRISFPLDEELEEFVNLKNKKEKSGALSKTLPVKLNSSEISELSEPPELPDIEPGEKIPSCSLMEYEALIANQKTPLDVIKYLKRISCELNQKIGGAVCPADTTVVPDDKPGHWIVNVKWALPVNNFALPDAPDPDELASWLVSAIPPKDPDAMSSSKGIFIDLDMSFFYDLTRKAYLVHSTQ